VLTLPTQPMRVVIGELPPLLTGIVTDIVGHEPDMEVTAVVARGESIAREVQRTSATVVIVGAGEADAACVSLLRLGPAPPVVLSLSSDGGEAFVHVAIGEISMRGLAHAIRRLSAILLDD